MLDGKEMTPEDLRKLKPTQITSFILRTKNRIMTLGMQRFISTYKYEPLSAVIPAIALSKLWNILDQVESFFKLILVFVLFVGFLSIFISMYLSLNYRGHEMAILKSLGVENSKVLILFLSEAMILSILGSCLGFFMQFVILNGINIIAESNYNLSFSFVALTLKDFKTFLIAIGIGGVFGFFPSVNGLYRYRLTLK